MSIVAKVFIGLGVVLVLAASGFAIYFFATHSCAEWEPVATGEKCVEYESYITVCSMYNGKTMTTYTCTQTRCVKHVPCKRCTKWVPDEELPAEMVIPEDKC